MTLFRRRRDHGLDAEALLAALRAFMAGDYSVRLPTDLTGVDGEIAKTVNEFIGARTAITDGFVRVCENVGRAGLLDSRLATDDLQGRLVEVAEAMNIMLAELTIPLNEMMQITHAVAKGDLSQRVPIIMNGKKKEGQFLIWAEMMNEMLDVLSTLASEVSRASREVGTEGKLGVEVIVPGISGIWMNFTDGINKP